MWRCSWGSSTTPTAPCAATTYAGFSYGGEGLAGNWSTWMARTVPPTADATATGIPRLYQYGNGAVRYLFTQNLPFDPWASTQAAFQARVQQVSELMDDTNPDMSAFFARGELEGWVERGVKPSNQLELVNGEPLPPYSVVASKPMCRYPAYPRYVGTSPAGASVASNCMCATS